MKRLILPLLCALSIATTAQTINREVDEFTHSSKAITSWQTLKNQYGAQWKYSFRQIDSTLFFDLKINGKGYVIGRDDELYFKMANDSVVIIKAASVSQVCMGCGANGFMGSNAMGTKCTYDVSRSALALLIKNHVVKFRLQTTEGYLDLDISEEASESLRKSASLLIK